MVGKDTRPHHVYLEDIDVTRFGGQQLLIKRKSLVAVIRSGDKLHAVSRGVGPGFDPAAANLELDANGATGNRDGRTAGGANLLFSGGRLATAWPKEIAVKEGQKQCPKMGDSESFVVRQFSPWLFRPPLGYFSFGPYNLAFASDCDGKIQGTKSVK